MFKINTFSKKNNKQCKKSTIFDRHCGGEPDFAAVSTAVKNFD